MGRIGGLLTHPRYFGIRFVEPTDSLMLLQYTIWIATEAYTKTRDRSLLYTLILGGDVDPSKQ